MFGQRDVHDRRVEDLEDRRQHHAEHHQPAAQTERRGAAVAALRASAARLSGRGHRRSPRGRRSSAPPRRSAAAVASAPSSAICTGHALHDLGEVPGGVVGREQRVLRAGGGRDRLDVAAPAAPGIGVDADLGAVARLHASDLGLLEVRGHPVAGGRRPARRAAARPRRSRRARRPSCRRSRRRAPTTTVYASASSASRSAASAWRTGASLPSAARSACSRCSAARSSAAAASRSATRGVERGRAPPRASRPARERAPAPARRGAGARRRRGPAPRRRRPAALACVIRLRAASRSARACATRASKSAGSSRTSGWPARHLLVLVDQHLDHLARDARREEDQVPLDEGVVGALAARAARANQ